MLPVNFIKVKQKTPQQRGFYVVPPRIELGTHGFSVRCSTN